MKPISRRLAVLTLVALVLALGGACGGSSSGTGVDVEALRAELRAPGPHPVGVRSVELTDLNRPGDSASRGPRFVYTEVWYPADEGARGARPSPLSDYVPEGLSGVAGILDLFAEVELPGVRGAAVATTGAPFPVIGFSHGNQGLRFQNYTLAAHLASHGFVVFAPDHIGNALLARRVDGRAVFFEDAFGPETLADRVADMRFLMDQFEGFARPGSGSFLEGRIDPGRGFGMGGHSFGGATAIGVAAEDARVVSVLPLASAIFDEFLTPPILQPAFVVIATEDKTIGEEGNAGNRALFENSTGRRGFAEFVNGGHFSPSDSCELSLGLVGAGDGCGRGTRFGSGAGFDFIDPQRFWSLLNPQATAFFGWTLQGDERMPAVLRSNPDPGEILYADERL